jgi:hypothetical protein
MLSPFAAIKRRDREPNLNGGLASAVAVGMARQGYDLQLTRYDENGWRATFYTSGMEHSPTSATGTGWEPTPWRTTQRAAGGGRSSDP